jgi:hypothetical protein
LPAVAKLEKKSRFLDVLFVLRFSAALARSFAGGELIARG